jgi:hypothetical protein
MDKKFFISTVVVFIITMACGFIGHGILLHGEYSQLPGLFRTEEDSKNYFGYMLLAHAIMSGAMVWIYRQGKTGKPFLAQGLRYGFAIALVCSVPLYLIYYAVQPMPETLVVKQVIVDTVQMLLAGVAIAWIEQ